MYRAFARGVLVLIESPHKRGDVPEIVAFANILKRISPQAWGCTEVHRQKRWLQGNLPTSVGMYRQTLFSPYGSRQSPHKRGDVPLNELLGFDGNTISPQAWGCTELQRRSNQGEQNLPTSVGMYLVNRLISHAIRNLPTSVGMIPRGRHREPPPTKISPQAWGCTVEGTVDDDATVNLPTSVGMYRVSIRFTISVPESPHKRGDVPFDRRIGDGEFSISPQAWGCTGIMVPEDERPDNLPTSVGMYRMWSFSGDQGTKSPHKRGDVPYLTRFDVWPGEISPQAWGCTVMQSLFGVRGINLPTSVGMYRPRQMRSGGLRKSPHKRGDVPAYVLKLLPNLRISPQAWGCTVREEQGEDSYENLPTSVGMYRWNTA